MAPKVVTIFNEKGGCGKTTTVLQLAYYLGLENSVLLIDLDKQANSTSHLTGRADHKNGVFQVFTEDRAIKKSVVPPLKKCWKNLVICPGDRRLMHVEKHLANEVDIDRILQHAIADTGDFFEYILIDTPPTLGFETRSALIASTHYLIVTDMSEYSGNGTCAAQDFATMVSKKANKSLRSLGILLTCYEKANAIGVKNALSDLKSEPEFLDKWKVPHSTKILEAQKKNAPIGQLFPMSSAAKIYKSLSQHLIKESKL